MRRRMIVDLSSARLNLIFNARRHLKNGLTESEHALEVTAEKILEQLFTTSHKTATSHEKNHPTYDDSYETHEDEPAVVTVSQRAKHSTKAPLRLVHL